MKNEEAITIKIINIQGDIITLNLELRGEHNRYFYDGIKVALGNSIVISDNQPEDVGYVDHLVKLPRSIGDLEIKE